MVTSFFAVRLRDTLPSGISNAVCPSTLKSNVLPTQYHHLIAQFWGPIFKKILWKLIKNLPKSLTYKKLRMSMWFSKKILQKSYEKLRTKLCKLTTTLQVSYENVKFVASDVIRETLRQRLLLVEYFELKITDNHSDDFLRMLSKNDLPFSWKNLRKSYLTDLQKTYENLTTNLRKNLTKILGSFKNRAFILHSQWPVTTLRSLQNSPTLQGILSNLQSPTSHIIF